MEKVLKGTSWTMEDVNTLESELLDNISQLNGSPKELRRIANSVSNKMNMVRALLHAERFLETKCGVRFLREDV
jgi:hypothetical protein